MRGILLVLLLLPACANNDILPLRPLELATAPFRDVTATSLTGSLMHEGGCLLFRDQVTKQHFLPVWPQGSLFNGTSVIFHEPAKADQRIVLGEEFVMSGQPVQWTDLDPSYYARFERQCGAAPFLVSGIRPAA